MDTPQHFVGGTPGEQRRRAAAAAGAAQVPGPMPPVAQAEPLPLPQSLMQPPPPVTQAQLNEAYGHYRPALESLTADTAGRIDFPATLTDFERSVVHQVAEQLGLIHESVGEGASRHIYCCSRGYVPPEPEPEPEPRSQPQLRAAPAPVTRARHPLVRIGSQDQGDDEDDAREQEASMREVQQLIKIRELHRRNIADGVGDSDGTDERVVAMYASLIQTAGLVYQNVVQHERVAKGLTVETGLERVPTKRVEAEEACPLCMEVMGEGTDAAALPCCGKLTHHSHVRPSATWAQDPNQPACCGIENGLELVGSCPLCRQDAVL